MLARTYGVAFSGIEPVLVQVECSTAPGLPGFSIVGLADKAVSEARERIRASLSQMRISLPSRKITVNLSPADLPKVGAQFDLPIALALLAAIDAIPPARLSQVLSFGELNLAGEVQPGRGALPAAMLAAGGGRDLICPRGNGAEAAWAGETPVFEAGSLIEAMRHLTGDTPLAAAQPLSLSAQQDTLCLSQVRGQERAKRGMEIAAAGRHHLLMVGPPGSGKTMLAERLCGILPQLSATEILETSIIRSVAGTLGTGGLSRERPFCRPHHTASKASMVGGGKKATPGQVSLAHNGVLFLDEIPEFSRDTLESLRQPIEDREITVARAAGSHRFPCRFQLVAAANPCRCGYLSDPAKACGQAPRCGGKYLSKLSGPLLDRIDIQIEVPPVSYQDLSQAPSGERSQVVAARVRAARATQTERYAGLDGIHTNADAPADLLDRVASPTPAGRVLLQKADHRFGLTARSYFRLLRLARTIADLEGAAQVDRPHLAEAIGFRLSAAQAVPA